MTEAIGSKLWAIPEGYIPDTSNGPAPDMTSHEAACILNTTDECAYIRLTIYFADREPVGPYHLEVEPRRTRHVRFNDLHDPAPIPRGTSYSSLFESSVNVVIQHTRLDSRQSENALLSTIAFAAR